VVIYLFLIALQLLSIQFSSKTNRQARIRQIKTNPKF
jgi:hypothetical protein